MSDFIGKENCNEVSPPSSGRGVSIRWVDDGIRARPAIGMTLAQVWRGASVLVDEGKGSLHEYIRSQVEWPPPGPCLDSLQAGLEELVGYWREEFEAGFDPREMEADSDGRFDDEDRIVIGWLIDGELPSERDMMFELAWPSILAWCTEFADKHLPRSASSFEKNELSSYRVSRWLAATSTFAGRDWIPRAEMFSAYEMWARIDSGQPAGKPADFYAALEELGYPEAKRRGVRGFRPARN